MVDINDYKYISFPHTQYIIEDKDNINPELNPATLQAEISKLKFKVASYSNKKEYYAVFKVNDIYGNSVNSDLIKIN